MLAAAVFCLGQTKDNILSVFQVQTEAQADGPPVMEEEEEAPGEDGGGSWKGWRKGYEPKDIKVLTGGSFGFLLQKYPGLSAGITYGYIRCCCRAKNEMVACNTGMEHSDCGKYRNNLE